MRSDFVDQAHRDPSFGRLRPRTGAPARPYVGIVHEWQPDPLTEPVEPGPVRVRPLPTEPLVDRIVGAVLAVLLLVGTIFILAHLLVAAGVGSTC